MRRIAKSYGKAWTGLSSPNKLPKSSRGQGVWLIETRDDWQRYCVNTDVLYAQELLPINKDLRIVVVGNTVVDGYWRLQASRGFYNNVAQGGSVDRNEAVPRSAIDLVTTVAAALGIDYAGFDIAMVGDFPYILEFNRLFGTQGIAGGQASLNAAIWDYLQSQLQRPKPTANANNRKLKQLA